MSDDLYDMEDVLADTYNHFVTEILECRSPYGGCMPLVFWSEYKKHKGNMLPRSLSDFEDLEGALNELLRMAIVEIAYEEQKIEVKL